MINLTSNNQMSTPQNYDGQKDPSAFIQYFKLQSFYMKWTEADQLKVFPLFLTGNAKIAYDIENATPMTTIEEVYTALRAKCGQAKESRLIEFYDRELKQGETIAKYASVLRTLLAEAQPAIDENTQECLLRAQVGKAVPANCRTMFKLSASLKGVDLNSLIDTIDKDSQGSIKSESEASGYASPYEATKVKHEPVETNFVSTNQYQRSYQNRQQQPQSRFSQQYQHNNNQRQFHQQQVRQPQARQQQQFSGVCYFCDQPGHRQAECPERREYFKQRNGSRNRNVDTINSASSNNTTDQANNKVEDSVTDESSFPFSYSWPAPKNTYNQSITVATMSTAVEADLMKIQIEVSLLGEPKRKLWALIDNGSSHCFFAPRVLSPSQLSLLETMSSEAITVTSATEVKESKAFISEAIVSINDSNFLQSFITSDAVQKHDAVL